MFFFALISITIQATTTTKQLIHTTGLTANRDIHIAKKPKINVRAKAITPVQTPIILDKNGKTFARVVINSNIIENHINITTNSNPLNNRVKFLFCFCALANICSALDFQFSNSAIDFQFDAV
ncbi:hypothetical protein J5751_03790 [bacterium]|nr:hypothetical protein [bacterium]